MAAVAGRDDDTFVFMGARHAAPVSADWFRFSGRSPVGTRRSRLTWRLTWLTCPAPPRLCRLPAERA
ncbi:UL90 [Human betaherpesvirus 5]|uniref:UL90 n=1 Tax=Human cytomegalovirus TaxID=10359 RepID=A8T7H2_HCMV|nr:UL90 [Human betaherpesvirus 5]APA46111.1 UL90 [Human betaherpesvirus 5]